MKGASRGVMLRASSRDEEGRPYGMLYAGLDLSRKRLDFRLLDELGRRSSLVRRRRTPLVCAAWPLVSIVSVSRCGRRSSL